MVRGDRCFGRVSLLLLAACLVATGPLQFSVAAASGSARSSNALHLLVRPAIAGSQVARLDMADGAEGAEFGIATALSDDGNTVIVGARSVTVGANQEQGLAYVFEKPAAGWADATETAILAPSDGVAYNHFGCAVAIAGDTVVVGAYGEDSELAATVTGSAYVFVRPAGGWSSCPLAGGVPLCTETAKLTASDGSYVDLFGRRVDISGETIVVGANQNQIAHFRQGAAYVYVKPASGWVSATETARLTASDAAAYDYFGTSVAISGDTIAVGAPEKTPESAGSEGVVYVYVKPVGGWTSGTEVARLTASDGQWMHRLGYSVAVGDDGSTVAAGTGSPYHVGASYVYLEPAGGWAGDLTESARLGPSDGQDTDHFGYAVAMDGDRIVIGAYNASAGGISEQGSVYVFEKPAGGWGGSLTEAVRLNAVDGATWNAFGLAVDIRGDTVAVGAPWDDVEENDRQGTAYVLRLGPSEQRLYVPLVNGR